MNYREIKINNNTVNKRLDLILTQIGKWHNLTPKIWRPEYRVTFEDIQETIERIKNTKSEDLFLMVAEDNQGEVKGFIWANKQEEPQDSIMILSLYVTEDCRGQGIATELKKLLEKWCIGKGIKTIQTTTHYNNHSMIELNKKLGYVPGMVRMTKTL